LLTGQKSKNIRINLKIKQKRFVKIYLNLMNNSVKVSTSLKVNNYIKNLNLKDMNNH
jgi:hypothetical protein